MAALANSTPAPAFQPGPVTLAITAMRNAQTYPESRLGLGCVILDDGPVFFDTKGYPDTGAPVLVIFGDGRLAVVTMPDMDDDPRQGVSPGFLMVKVDKPYCSGGRITREQAALIGAVRQ